MGFELRDSELNLGTAEPPGSPPAPGTDKRCTVVRSGRREKNLTPGPRAILRGSGFGVINHKAGTSRPIQFSLKLRSEGWATSGLSLHLTPIVPSTRTVTI